MKYKKRHLLSVASAVCVTAASMATSVYADVCGSGLSLPANVWTMFSAPCTPPAGSESVAAQFDADLGSKGYGNEDTGWIMFKWNPAAGDYDILAATDKLEQDTGYWIFSYTPGTLKIDNGTHTTGIVPTAGDNGYYGDCTDFGWEGKPCYKIDLEVPTSESQWNLVGYPFVRSTKWADVHVAYSTNNGATWTDVGGPSDADNEGYISKNGYVYNDSGSAYNVFDDTADSPSDNTLLPNKSYWIQSKYISGTTNLALLVPAPPYTVFVTSQILAGDLGGLSGADETCQLAADSASLSGIFVAWVYDINVMPKERLDLNGPLVFVLGRVIVTSLSGSDDSILMSEPQRDEGGNLITSCPVKTGWNQDGYYGAMCASLRYVYERCKTTGQYCSPHTGINMHYFCTPNYRLMCFEQD
ncbi:MAG: hypothetical protein D3919_09255 [Candidatus Electrothrix sp. AW5]|nr:hypothetical protein [Candidatus Electrothrix gigas]